MSKRSTETIDRIVGHRIKAARLAAKLSQEKLANCLDVTFQQIQKYEKGNNRVSVGALLCIARAVGVTPLSLIKNIEIGDPS